MLECHFNKQHTDHNQESRLCSSRITTADTAFRNPAEKLFKQLRNITDKPLSSDSVAVCAPPPCSQQKYVSRLTKRRYQFDDVDSCLKVVCYHVAHNIALLCFFQKQGLFYHATKETCSAEDLTLA